MKGDVDNGDLEKIMNKKIIIGIMLILCTSLVFSGGLKKGVSVSESRKPDGAHGVVTQMIKSFSYESDAYREYFYKTVCEEYSKICASMSSEPIKDLPKGKNAIRLISISSYPCYIIKLVWTNHKQTIEFTEGDVEVTKATRTKTLKVSKEDIKELLALMNEKDFYNQPDYVKVSGRDGETWFVESNIDGRYKVIERWSPEDTFLHEIGRKLLRLAGEGMSDEEEEAASKELEEYRKSIRLPTKKL